MKLHMLCSAAVIAATLMGASAASAATLIETGSYGFAPTDFSKGDGDAWIISIADFNPALGKLESIVITFTANDEANASATNNNPKTSKGSMGAVTGVAKLDSDIKLQGPDGKNTFTFGTLSPTNTVSDKIAAGASTNFGGLLTSSLSDTYTLSPNSPSKKLFDTFIGTGDYNFLLDATAESTVKGSGNFSSSIATEAQGIVSVEYNYAAVPEPATWAVMFVGFGGMGVAMRRSRRIRAAATA
jgi:hypothetical protein